MSKRRKHFAALATLALLTAAAFTVRAVEQPRNNFHVAFVGDRTGSATPEIYGRVWREIDLLHPDLVVNVGDTIEGRDDATVEKQWEAMRPLWKRYSHYPLYFTPGNHDIFSGFSERIYVRETRNQPNYSFHYQSAHFTVLDNSRGEDLSPAQLEFLEKDLKANRNRTPKFILFHRPFWIGKIRASGADFPLHRIAKQYGAGYIISGHGHRFVRMVRDGIAYMEVGSSGGDMRKRIAAGEGFDKGTFYHFVWTRVEGEKALMTVKEVDGAAGKGRMFRADDWDEQGPHFDVNDPASSYKPET